ncbi:hypothetical protein HD806DRAFT_547937 [Xylariaceae sp. AK1471]|nr:hypothetical protein HD806DRAFT_547937 [Xylariaceae sp. AK1471]
MVHMAGKVDADTYSDGACPILEAALAMIVDTVVATTATFKGHRQGSIEKTIVVNFKSRVDIILTYLTQLKAEFQLQILSQWIELNRAKKSTDVLITILRDLDFGLDTCPRHIYTYSLMCAFL